MAHSESGNGHAGGKVGEEQGTVVSFVINHPEQLTTSGDSPNECEQNGYLWTLFLAPLYAIILLIIGIAHPLSEALNHTWLQGHDVGVFLTYLFSVSSVFLVYLQVEIYLKRRRERLSTASVLAEAPPESPSRDASDALSQQPHDMMLLRLRQLYPGHKRPEAPTLYPSLTESSKNASTTVKPERDLMRKVSQFKRKGTSSIKASGLSRHMSIDEQVGQVDQGHDNAGFETEHHGNQVSQAAPHHTIGSSASDNFGKNRSLSTVSEVVTHEDDLTERFILLHQTASLAHEGASFYLRLGCLFFGLANFVFVAVEIQTPREEAQKQLLYPRAFQFVFLLIQTFFIFKHTAIPILRRRGLIRMGLCHVLATNMCIWIRVLINEVLEAFHTLEEKAADDCLPGANNTEENNTTCEQSKILSKITPYLFPFVLEYSLIAVAVMASMFHGLNFIVTTDLLTSLKNAVKNSLTDHGDDTSRPPNDDGGFFSKSHRGSYLGILLLSGIICSILVFFYKADATATIREAVKIYFIADIFVHVCLITAVCVAHAQMRKLHLTFNRDNAIDNLLLLLSLSGLVLLQVFILNAAFSIWLGNYPLEHGYDTTTEIMSTIRCILNIVSGLLQTLFICNSLHRVAPSAEIARNKPGRGTVTFLIIANVAQWIFKSFQVKELDLTDLEKFYGQIAWPVILNISLPLLLFYRFHSSVCLADIWNCAYEMENGPKYRAL